MLPGSLERLSGQKQIKRNRSLKGKLSLSAPVDLRSKQNINRKPEFEGQKKIKKLVIWSFAGFLVWSIALVTWIAVFTTNRCFSYQKYFSIELCVAHSGLLGEQLPTTWALTFQLENLKCVGQEPPHHNCHNDCISTCCILIDHMHL